MLHRVHHACLVLLLVSAAGFAVDPPKGLRILGTSTAPGGGNQAGTYVEDSCSRTTGVAPLSVHFVAGFAASATGPGELHTLDYSWDFGDALSGQWGTTGKQRNTAKGAVAAHVYEKSGTFTATLTVRAGSSIVRTRAYRITVTDPDIFYGGTRTTCVTDNAHAGDFSGAPAGSRQVTTDNLADVMPYVTAGSRILFRRGSSWTTGGLTFPKSGGPVTVGAYGTGTGQNAQGIYSNAPLVTVTGGTFCDLSDKQDWRIMDLHLVDPTRSWGTFGGTSNMQRILFLRLRVEGFSVGIGWSHYNDGPLPLTIDQMVVADCEVTDGGMHTLYLGGERLALLGNVARDAHSSHVIRVWQLHKGVISHNLVSGASLDNMEGRHALKLHGPGGDEYGTPASGTIRLANRTEFSVISDNAFGGSGPWPVAMGPQDAGANEELRDIVFERNRVVTGYGAQSATPVQASVLVWGRFFTVRNNVVDGTASSGNYAGIVVTRRGVEPPPEGVAVYNNTIYRRDNTSGNERKGIVVGQPASGTVIRNNLVSFPGASVFTALIADSSASTASANNLLTGSAGFADPDNADPLARDFRLLPGSPARDKGSTVPVFDDFAGGPRPIGAYDIGAFEGSL
jgi:hypothetical protein